MNLTDDVIRDLLPLVNEGEASADTVALVQAYVGRHPHLAAEARRNEAWVLPPVTAAPDSERVALRRTKRLLTWRTWSMAAALFFTALPLSLRGHDDGRVHFLLLTEHPSLAAASLVVGLACWVAFIRASRSLRPAGF